MGLGCPFWALELEGGKGKDLGDVHTFFTLFASFFYFKHLLGPVSSPSSRSSGTMVRGDSGGVSASTSMGS